MGVEAAVASDAERIAKRIDSEPRHAAALLRLLDFCREPRRLDEIDARVGGYPEMRASAFPPRTILAWLVDVGGIEELPADPTAEGTTDGITDDAPTCGDESPADHAHHVPCFQTSEAGLDAFATRLQGDALAELVLGDQALSPAYLALLDACAEQPRSRSFVERLLGEKAPLRDLGIYPSVLVDRLERAGGLTWDEGWRTTPAANHLLAGE